MRVAVVLVGSRGDVQPGLVVARGLLERGHEVALGVPPNLLDLAASAGLDARPVGIDSRELLASDLVRHDLRSRRPVRRVRALSAVATVGWDEVRPGTVELARGADLVVTGLLGQEVASAVAEKEGCGFAALHYAPVRANPVAPVLPGVDSVTGQRLGWWAGERLRWGLTRRAENSQRTALGLPPAVVDLPRRLRERGALEIQVYDEALVPGLAERWGPRRPFAGYLAPAGAPDTESDPDPELEELLARRPVHVGFGSMPVTDPARLLATLEEVARRLDVPILLGAGWSDLPPPAPGGRVVVRRTLDHPRVLPRCRASVHHGGAGTVGACLRAGVPQVVAWWSADQPMWGTLVDRAGVGRSLPFSRLGPDPLHDALVAVLDGGHAARAETLAGRVVEPAEALRRTLAALERAA